MKTLIIVLAALSSLSVFADGTATTAPKTSEMAPKTEVVAKTKKTKHSHKKMKKPAAEAKSS